MERYLCIHCHFYQPPRENPWLEAIELQDSAYPYHDWNERITAECYAPNSAARILDPERRIVKIVSNYERISFNFGPTLLSWMETKAPEAYAAILAADQASACRFGGHGSALAQAYNHMIMPLASRRDRRSQVLWGVRDFQHRFGRDPEGMWLPETAVDMDTLETLVDAGIRFTILAPHQARQVRRGRRGNWRDVEGARIDPTRAYVCRLAAGQSIALFFYDGPISRAVAFEGLLSDGIQFAERLLGGFNDARKWPQLMHIATDGETYGHHSAHGDMALAYALHHIESNRLATITNYGEYLEKHPPVHEVEIMGNTSWSCSHGLERWREDCGCSCGGREGWDQQWRRPLRDSLDWLRDILVERFEEKARELLRDPWAARDDYARVMADRSPEKLWQFFERHGSHPLQREELVTALKLLELQRHAMLMFTSCGWFFAEISGIETVQVLFYAGRVLQLAREVLGEDLEPQFLERLAQAPSNIRERENGARIYQTWVKPAVAGLWDVGAHYAISATFDGKAPLHEMFCYEVTPENYRAEQAGRARLAVGHARIRSRITLEEADIAFGVLHFGDHNIGAGVGNYAGEAAYGDTVHDLLDTFAGADMAEVLRHLDRHFAGKRYSLKSLFRDEQRRILGQIMEGILGEAEASYRGIYEGHAALMHFLTDLRMPLPAVLRQAAEFVLNGALRRALEASELDLDGIVALTENARQEGVVVDTSGLGYSLRQRLEQMMRTLVDSPSDLGRLQDMQSAVQCARCLGFQLDLWRVQNLYWQLLQSAYPAACASEGEDAREWCECFLTLGEVLSIKVQPLPLEIPIAA
jgi:alpha-amylase/alpha-mannosidase (GH57 family)